MDRAVPLAPLLFLLGCPQPSSGFGSPNDDDATTPAADDDDELPPLADETLLVSFDDEQGLMVVDAATGAGTLAFPTPDGVGGVCSTVFTRDGRLYGSAGRDLYLIDPCEGTAELIGEYSDGGSICGMAAKELGGLYGLNRDDDTLVRIDEETAELTVIGALGWDVGAHALTWDREYERFLAIDGRENRLMRVDPDTGGSNEIVSLDLQINQVGAEKDPVTNELYLCTGPDLYAVDVETGEVELRGRIGADEQCNDLGATWVEVACLSP